MQGFLFILTAKYFTCMSVPTNIHDQLIRDEGLRLKAYKDSLGKWTIGVGHELYGVVSDPFDLEWSEERCMNQLQADIDTATRLVSSFPWYGSMDVCRQGVLINMAFQMDRKLLQFKDMLAHCAAHDYIGAAGSMLAWARECPERSARLAQQMRLGLWQ
jgi:lysozyme